ncbi:hypothetical protein D3C75_1276810 [compost metagenome]
MPLTVIGTTSWLMGSAWDMTDNPVMDRASTAVVVRLKVKLPFISFFVSVRPRELDVFLVKQGLQTFAR